MGIPFFMDDGWLEMDSGVFSPDGSYIGFTSNDTALVWKANGLAAHVVQRAPGQILRKIAFSPDNAHFAASEHNMASGHNTIRVWEIDRQTEPLERRPV